MNLMAIDLSSDSFHSPSPSGLHFSSDEVYDLSADPGRSQTSVIDDEDIIQQTQRNIDNGLSSPSLLSLDDYNHSRITRIPRPEVQDSNVDLAGHEQSDMDESLGTQAQQPEEQTVHTLLPVLSANPVTTASSETSHSNIILMPAPQHPVVNCGGLQLTHQDIQQIQQQLQQRLLSQPMTTAPPVHLNLPPQQYVILGTVKPNMQPQFIIPAAPAPQAYTITDLSTPILQQINNLVPNTTASSTMAVNDSPYAISSKPTSKLTKAPSISRQSNVVQLHSKPEDISQLKELQNFAKHFKQRRVELGYTQGDVGSALGYRFPNDFSQTTISRFEASNLSAPNMRKIMPLLQRWLDDQEHRQPQLVSDTFAQRTSPEPVSDAKRRKKRTTIEDSVKDLLEICFYTNPKPNASDLSRIANAHNIEREVVRVWFCNRRQREKKCGVKYSAKRPVMMQDDPTTNSSVQVVSAQIIQPETAQNLSGTSQSSIANASELIESTQSATEEDKSSEESAQTASEKAALSAAMMSPQGATMKGYVKPIVFNNG